MCHDPASGAVVYGKPACIVGDNGTEFTGTLGAQGMCRSFGSVENDRVATTFEKRADVEVIGAQLREDLGEAIVAVELVLEVADALGGASTDLEGGDLTAFDLVQFDGLDLVVAIGFGMGSAGLGECGDDGQGLRDGVAGRGAEGLEGSRDAEHGDLLDRVDWSAMPGRALTRSVREIGGVFPV